MEMSLYCIITFLCFAFVCILSFGATIYSQIQHGNLIIVSPAVLLARF